MCVCVCNVLMKIFKLHVATEAKSCVLIVKVCSLRVFLCRSGGLCSKGDAVFLQPFILMAKQTEE